MAPRYSQSDTAAHTRKAQELIDNGFNQTQAAEAIGVNQSTVSRNLAKATRFMEDKSLIEAATVDQYSWLQNLKAELADPKIKPDRRIELALGILDREMRLLGTAAPTKSQSVSANINLDSVDPATLPEYRRWLYETRNMDSVAKEKAFQLIRDSGLNVRRPTTIEVPTSSPLWNEPKKLPEGDDETA